MARERTLLAQPVTEGVATIVRAHLRDARRGLRDLDAGHREGLHRFRVAIRRTRTTLEAYRPWLGAVRDKDHQRLRDLMRTTNATRDAEVLLPRLRRMVRQLPDDERAALEGVRRRLRRAARRLRGRRRDDLVDELRRRRRTLRHRLPASARAGEPLGHVLGALVADDASRLAQELAALAETDRPEHLHTLRLSTKRLRYLLEPVMTEIPTGASTFATLRHLQRSLGMLHDLDVLSAVVRDAVGADATIHRRLDARRERHAHALRARWSDREATELVRGLERLAWMLVGEPSPRRAAPHPAAVVSARRRVGD